MPDIDFWYLGGVHFAIQKIFKIFPILNKIQKGALKHKNRNLTLTNKLYVLICDKKKYIINRGKVIFSSFIIKIAEKSMSQ